MDFVDFGAHVWWRGEREYGPFIGCDLSAFVGEDENIDVVLEEVVLSIVEDVGVHIL